MHSCRPSWRRTTRFAKAPFDDRDVHRPLAGHDDLDDAFAWKEERSVSVNLTLQYDQVLFMLEPTGIARSLARQRVTVIDYPDGRLMACLSCLLGHQRQRRPGMLRTKTLLPILAIGWLTPDDAFAETIR